MNNASNKTARESENVEELIGRGLQIGVLASAVLILAGLLLYLFTGRSGYPGATFPTSLPALFTGAAALKPYAVILLGLFVLILTPVFRVGFSIILFWKEKDFLYVRITTLVFAILLVSFFLGRAE